MKTVLSSAFFLLASCLPAAAAMDFYDASSRTIYVAFEQPVGSVAVHITGTSPLTGKCVAARSEVKAMNFIPGQTVRTNRTLTGKLSGAFKGLGAQVAASTSTQASATLPAVFAYNYTGTLRNLHYNIVFTRNNVSTARGWRPDNGGGCTYPVK